MIVMSRGYIQIKLYAYVSWWLPQSDEEIIDKRTKAKIGKSLSQYPSQKTIC